MTRKFNYTRQKFTTAIESMATSPKSIQKRLGNAYTYYLLMLTVEDLPEEIQSDFRDFCERLTKVEAKGNEGNINATIAIMTEIEAVELAEKILSMSAVVDMHCCE